jgi:hypothetical protein
MALAEPEKREQVKTRFSELLKNAASEAATVNVDPS